MNTDLKLALTHLAKGELVLLKNGREKRAKGVAVFGGDVWITQDSDPQDHVLSAGESFAFDRPGVAVAQALSDARLLVFDVDTRAAASADAQAKSQGPREPQGPRTSLEWYLEARRQRALAIGDAIARGFAAWGRLWLRLRTRVEPDVRGARPATGRWRVAWRFLQRPVAAVASAPVPQRRA